MGVVCFQHTSYVLGTVSLAAKSFQLFALCTNRVLAFLPPTNQFVSLATVVDLDKGVISWNRWMVWDEGHSSV